MNSRCNSFICFRICFQVSWSICFNYLFSFFFFFAAINLWGFTEQNKGGVSPLWSQSSWKNRHVGFTHRSGFCANLHSENSDTLAGRVQQGSAGRTLLSPQNLEQKTQFKICYGKKSAFWVCPHASKPQSFTQTKYKLMQLSGLSPPECHSKALLQRVPSITASPRSTLYLWFCWLTGWELLKPHCSKRIPKSGSVCTELNELYANSTLLELYHIHFKATDCYIRSGIPFTSEGFTLSHSWKENETKNLL